MFKYAVVNLLTILLIIQFIKCSSRYFPARFSRRIMNNFPKTLFDIEVDVMIVACIFKYGAEGLDYILFDVYDECFPKIDQETKLFVQQQNLLYFRYMELIQDSEYFQYLVKNFEYLTSMHYNMPDEEEIKKLIKDRKKAEQNAKYNNFLNKIKEASTNAIDIQNQLVSDDEDTVKQPKNDSKKHITLPQPIKQASSNDKTLALLSNYSSSSKNSDAENQTEKLDDSFKLEFLIYNQFMNSQTQPNIDEINSNQVIQKLGQLNYLKQMSLDKLYVKIADLFRQETQIVREQLENIQNETLKSLDTQYELLRTRTINYFESNYKIIEYFIEKTKDNIIQNKGLSKQLDQLVKLEKTIFNKDTLVNLLTLAKALKADVFAKACCIQLGKNIFEERILTNKELLDCTLIQPGDYELIMQSVSDADMHRLYHLEIECREAYEARQRTLGPNDPLKSSITVDLSVFDGMNTTFDKQKTTTLNVTDLQESRRILEMYRAFPLKLVPISYVLKEIDYRIAQLKAKYQSMSAIKQACVIQEKMPFYEILLPSGYKSSNSSSNILNTTGSEKLTKLTQGRTNQFMYRIQDSDGFYTSNNGLTVCFTEMKRFLPFKAQRSYVLSQKDIYIEIRIDKLGRNSLQIGMETPEGEIKTTVSNDGIIRQTSDAWDCPEAGFTDGDIVQFVIHGGAAGELRIYKNGVFTQHAPLFLARKGNPLVEFTVSGMAYLFNGNIQISINFTDPYFIAQPSWQDLDRDIKIE